MKEGPVPQEQVDELLNSLDSRFWDMTVRGKCSNCGYCCTDLLPVTQKEVDRLREYAQEHNLTEHTQAPFYLKDAVDLTCPFLDNIQNRCDVYAVRPKICRSFICSKGESQMTVERDRYTAQPDVSIRSLRKEIFGNPTSVLFTKGVLMEEYFAMKEAK